MRLPLRGLRISECLALGWSDIDWLNKRLRVERGIVERNVDDVKTDESRKSLAIADELLERLNLWRQTTEFSADSDWIFASPLKIGRLPYSYTGVWRELDRASEAAGLGHKQVHMSAIVSCGSWRCETSKRNCSTVRLRGCRTRLDAPFTVTKLIGFTCMGMACFHIAKFQSELRIPRMWVRLLGARGRDCNHSSTGRASRSVTWCSRHFGKMCSRIQDPYVRRVSFRSGIFSALYCSISKPTVGTPMLGCGLNPRHRVRAQGWLDGAAVSWRRVRYSSAPLP